MTALEYSLSQFLELLAPPPMQMAEVSGGIAPSAVTTICTHWPMSLLLDMALSDI